MTQTPYKWTAWETPLEASDLGTGSPYVSWTAEIKGDTSDFGAFLNDRARDGKGTDPIPEYAYGTKDRKMGADKADNSKPDTELLPRLSPDTVIVGAIDRGIPLGHYRFRDADGKSRILMAWQQVADRDRLKTLYSDNLKRAVVDDYKTDRPISAIALEDVENGTEFLKHEIDNLLRWHSFPPQPVDGPIDGWLDETEFNRQTGGEDFWNPEGDRGLSNHRSHGAHVLDAAAGCNPFEMPEQLLAEIPDDLGDKIKAGDFARLSKADIRRLSPDDISKARIFDLNQKFGAHVKIMAVNLPSRTIVGTSGRYLERFILDGINRIVQRADAIWEANSYKTDVTKTGTLTGYPIVINMSFAKQAGRRDGLDVISMRIAEINSDREKKGMVPVHFVFPTGNENLAQGNAETRIESGAEVSFDWRVQNDDHTANFVEIWTTSKRGTKITGKGRIGIPVPLAIQIIAPNGEASDFARARPGQQMDMKLPNESKTIARVYCRAEPLSGNGYKQRYQTQFVICTRPTNFYEADTPVAPAGVWTIKIRNDYYRPLSISANVQTDQSELPDAGTGLRAYFEHPTYDRIDDRGAWMDSYSYEQGNRDRSVNQDRSNILRRHGTMNAIGAGYEKSGYTWVIAGHRARDGKPVPYSATGAGADDAEGDKGRRAPTASFPSDDGIAHFGTMAAGARNGSVVALRGTSFSAAQATRFIAMQLVEKLGEPRTLNSVLVQFKKYTDTNTQFGYADIDKVGIGRIPMNTLSLNGVERID